MSLLDLRPETVSFTKSGGLFVAAIVLVGGFLRIVLPSGAVSQNAQSKTALKLAQATESPTARSAYARELAGKIAESFGCAEEADSSAAPETMNWRVPALSRGQAKFIIAFVPDPVHTHLSLLFDRDVEAMELAVPQIEKKVNNAAQNFVFDRSILPWKVPLPQTSGAAPSAEATKARIDREQYPGLLIFRANGNGEPASAKAPNTKVCPLRETLFVFLVAETPTSGIRSVQFQNALKIMRGIRAGVEIGAKSKTEPLLLLGPNFSGSLDSLGRQLKQIPDSQYVSDVIAYSGTVSGEQSAEAFRQSFLEHEKLKVRFASFQQSDDYATQMFVRFANSRGYHSDEIAVLSEADTVYGSQVKSAVPGDKSPVYLNFPREISYFRSAYEKQLAAQQQQPAKVPGKTALPAEIEDDVTADDEVAHYANGQTSLAQEAVMLGLVSELQKHHVKFTILLATNPVDQVFLARYLRTNYPQGRIVVTSPDLMLASQEDTLLFGVLGLNDYSLVPGLDDSLCRLRAESGSHEDRLFDSSSSVGIYNAMLGLATISFGSADPMSYKESYSVPRAPYASYTSPPVGANRPPMCGSSPVLWLTILGRDGYWPIAALTKDMPQSAFHDLPVVKLKYPPEKNSSLPIVAGAFSRENPEPMHTVPAWNVTYSLCLAVIILHIMLSWTGSFLSNSESKAQFARSHDRLGVVVIALGAFWLATSFVIVLCARNPQILWRGILGFSIVLWLPLPVFTVLTFYDIAFLRKQARVAWCFAVAVCLVTLSQILLIYNRISFAPYFWSNRLIHFSSGVSPVLPFLLLFVSGYWWAWQSLRSVSLVDLRRPRLPVASQLPAIAVRISDTEGERVRGSAHPLKVGWRIAAILGGVFAVSLTALELKHPLQSLEGWAFDLGYSFALALVICVFLSCLIRLVFTWFDYKQVLSGLDRSPLREAFSRMKRLSWRSMWNPGGSTLRETYRVMSRALENMEHLKRTLAEEKNRLSSYLFACAEFEEKTKNYDAVLDQIVETEKRVSVAQRIFRPLFPATDDFHPAPPDGVETGLVEFEDLVGKVEGALQKYDAFFTLNGRNAPDGAEIIARIKCAQAKFTVALERYRLLRGKTQGPKILPSAGKFNSSAQSIDKFVRSARLETVPAEIFLAHFENVVMDQEPLVASLESVDEELSKSVRNESRQQRKKICGEDRAKLVTGLMDSLEILQKQLANTAGSVFKKILDPIWKGEILPAVSEDERIKRPELDPTRAIAEEFVALVYVNFLQSVLLQMRSLVVCAGGMYVLILCSMSVYPFEPHPALQVLAVALVVVMAVVVGFVYAEMHRDAILSRLTSTTAGELGWDFWFKFISAGAIPVFSLLAVQFPEISKFLFSWLEPAVQALK